jgi:predicted nucleotidyltransferase
MIDKEKYLSQLTEKLRTAFGGRLAYIGLQGSYLRDEADESSDFDVMLVIDGLLPDDLDVYRGILISLGHYDLSCGFVCSREDLSSWNPLEICHVLHTTQDIYGELAPLMPAYTRDDVRNFVKLSVCNLFHELCHRYIHRSREQNIKELPGTYQPVFFILQNLHWLRTGVFVDTKRRLLENLEGEDREILAAAMTLKNAEDYDFDTAYKTLFLWCQHKLKETDSNL